MTLLCEPVQIVAVSRDRSRQATLNAPGAPFEFSALRSRVPTATAGILSCDDIEPFTEWCDFIEVRSGSSLLMRYLYDSVDRSNLTTNSVGLCGQFSRRRYDRAESFRGAAHTVWTSNLVFAADNIFPLGFESAGETLWDGNLVEFDVAAGTSMADIYQALAGVHVTFAEHAGLLNAYAVGSEPSGPPIMDSWLAPGVPSEPTVSGASYVNEILIRYTDTLTRTVNWPFGGVAAQGHDCRLQAQPLDFPEIRTEQAAIQMAEQAFWLLSKPNVSLEDIRLDPIVVDWDWLQPGRTHVSTLAGSDGTVFNLDQVVVRGTGENVTEVSARWDVNDVGLLRERTAAQT